MVVLDVSVVNVALPSIRDGLHFSEANLQWVVNANTVAFGGFLLLGGRAADLLGRRRVFVAGLVLFALTSLVGGMADSQTTLIAARAAQGLAAAVIAPASLSILTTTFSEGAARNRAVGIWGAMGGAGGSAGVLLGGALTQLLGWRWILFINVPIAAAAALASLRLLAEGRDRSATRSFDLLGAITATVGLSLLVLGIVRTDVTGWGSAQALGAMAAGLGLLGAFVAIEARIARQPLMPLRIYRSRALSASNTIVLLIGAATFAMWFFLSLYLQQVRGYSALHAGLSFLPMTLCIAAGSVFASRAVGRFGTRPLLVIGLLAQAVGLLLFTDISVNGSYLLQVLAPSLLVAIGIGLSFVPVTISAVAGVDPHEAGLASGLVNTSRLVGGALGLAVLAALATAQTNHLVRAGTGLHSALTGGFDLAFAVAAVVSLAGVLVAVVGLPRVSGEVLASRAAAAHAVEA
jgi:EmrB/QacA subfamily drug resistance transporter